MSWPTDGLPRFKPVLMEWETWRGPEADGYVYDRANCHAIVAHFPSVKLTKMPRPARIEAVWRRAVGFAAMAEAEHMQAAEGTEA